MPLAPKTRLGRYEILSPLGAGGMGEVYLAQDTGELDRTVALKFLPAEVGGDAQRLHRFTQEARTVSRLNHPNILTVYDFGQEDGRRFIATEYVDGVTLRKHVSGRRLRLHDVLDLAAQIADALSAAHEAGVVHRDVKPENVMVRRRDSIIKVLDFGLAKPTEKAAAGHAQSVDTEAGTALLVNTEPGLVMGTVAYMSPEQSQGLAVDARTDIWSVGVVLYEMLAGRLPFEAKDVHRQIIAIQEQEPPPLSQYVLGVPERLEEIVTKALAKDPGERYQTAKDLLIDLRRLKHKLEVDAEIDRTFAPEARGTTGGPRGGSVQPTVSGEPRKTSSAEYIVTGIRRHKAGVFIAAAVLAIAVAGAAFWVYNGRSREQPGPPADPLRVAPLTTSPGRKIDPAFSDDGKQVAYAWDGGGGDNYDIYVQLVEAGTPLRLTTNPADDQSPVWSPDGRHVAFYRSTQAETAVYTVAALGGTERKVATLTGPPWLSWSPDGKYLAAAERPSPQEPNSIFLISVENGEKRRVTTPPSGYFGDMSPKFSPDGLTLAFIRSQHNLTGDLYTVPAGGGEPKPLTGDKLAIQGLTWTPDAGAVVFSSNRGGNFSLWRVPVSGGPPELLPGVGEYSKNPSISRQGNRLAYVFEKVDSNVWRAPRPNASAKNDAPVKFISSTREENNPRYSPDGRRILFGSDRSGNWEVWVCESDGTNPVQLTNFRGPNTGTGRWSPGGRQIAFDSRVGSNSDIYVISADGGTPRRLTSEDSEENIPSWSHDGRWVYFSSTRGGVWQIWKAPTEGGQAVQVTRGGGFEAYESADGKSLYFIKRRSSGVWRMPAEGGEEVQVLDQPVEFNNWALTDRGIYFLDRRGDTPAIKFFEFASRQVSVVAAVDKEPNAPGSAPGFSVSPDEQWFLYKHVDRVDNDIMVVEGLR